jgi:hypothetical protein
MNKGKTFKTGYATVGDDGVNYREIAETMSQQGYVMNHSSARNHIVRAMSKFAVALVKRYNIPSTTRNIEHIAKNPSFQSAVCEIITRETNKRK